MELNQVLGFLVKAKVEGSNQINELLDNTKKLRKETSEIRSTFSQATSAVKALAGAYAVKEAVNFLKTTIDIGDELKNSSEKMGISVSQLSKLRTAAELADVPFAALQTGVKKLNVTMSEAQHGNLAAQKTLAALGITSKDTGTAINQAADTLSKMKDGADKARLSVAGFGKQGTELIPMFNEGSAGMNRFGLAISDDFANRADQFNDTMTILKTKSQQFAIDGVGVLLPTLQDLGDALKDFETDNSGTVGFFEDLAEAARLTAVAMNSLVATGITIGDTVGVGIRQAWKDIKGDFEGANRLGEEFYKRTAERLEKQAKLQARFLKNSMIFGEGTESEIRERLKRQTKAPARKRGTADADMSALEDETLQKKIKSENEAIAKMKEREAAEAAVMRLQLQRYDMSDAQFREAVEHAKVEGDIAKATVGWQTETAAAYRDAAEAAYEEQRKVRALGDAQKESYSHGAKEALHDYLEAARDVASQTKNLFTNAFKGMEDGVVAFAKTGKFSFADFANAVIDDIIRIQVRMALAGIISSITGAFAGGSSSGGGLVPQADGAALHLAADGGVMSSRGMLPLNTYASGGIARSPQVAIFGEGRMPEAYVPLPDGHTIPVTMRGDGSAGGTVIHQQIYITPESGDVKSAQQSGKEYGNVIIAAVRAELIKQKRNGGML